MRIQNDNLIKKWEELRLEAYLPTPNDVPTIGWGHTQGVKMGQTISRRQAQEYFEQDVAWVERALAKHIKVGLTQNQYDALASWVFNIGETNFASSTLLRKLNAGDYEGAARELPRWNKQKGKVLRGLTRRRAEEMEYFLKGGNPSAETYPRATPDKAEELKPLTTSKEVIAGSGAVLTGVGALLAGVGDQAQLILSVALSVALLGFGAFVVYNRVSARAKAER